MRRAGTLRNAGRPAARRPADGSFALRLGRFFRRPSAPALRQPRRELAVPVEPAELAARDAGGELAGVAVPPLWPRRGVGGRLAVRFAALAFRLPRRDLGLPLLAPAKHARQHDGARQRRFLRCARIDRSVAARAPMFMGFHVLLLRFEPTAADAAASIGARTGAHD